MLYLLIKGRKSERLKEAPVQLRHYLFQSSDLGSTFNFSIITSCLKKILFYPLIQIFGSKGSNMGKNSIVLFSPGAPLVVRLKVQVYKQNIINRMNHDFGSNRHKKLLGHDHHYYKNRHHHNICNESPPPLQIVIFES